jgi:hypothetical protein
MIGASATNFSEPHAADLDAQPRKRYGRILVSKVAKAADDYRTVN